MGPFALYSAATCLGADQVQAGQVFDLDRPIVQGGATLFRQSLWLPVSAAARLADGLRLAADATLALRFDALEVHAAASDSTWLPECKVVEPFLHLALALPIPVVRIDGGESQAFELHRRDGKAVSAEALQSGQINAPLAPPFTGTALALKLPHLLLDNRVDKLDVDVDVAVAAPRSRAAPGAQGVHAALSGKAALADRARRDGAVSALRLAGRPTGARARLVLPGSGGTPDESLWLDLRPGEQAAAVTLPAASPALSQQWGPALEQLKAAPTETPVAARVLRLDLESDAPCRVTLQSATLALVAETELLAAPQTLRFSGTRRETLPVALTVPAAAVQQIAVTGTVSGDGASAALASSTLPGDGRTGVLLEPERRVVRGLDIATPQRLAGVGLPWHPLSDAATWHVQLSADGGGAPTARPLVEATVTADTPAPAWIALRWPPQDLQAGRYWLRLVASDGMGVWLTGDEQPVVAGWVESAQSPRTQVTPLGGTPAAQCLLSPPATGTANPPPSVELRLGSDGLIAGFDTSGVHLGATRDYGAGATLTAATIDVSCSQACTLKIESVKVTQAL